MVEKQVDHRKWVQHVREKEKKIKMSEVTQSCILPGMIRSHLRV